MIKLIFIVFKIVCFKLFRMILSVFLLYVDGYSIKIYIEYREIKYMIMNIYYGNK